jgi:hypothetical protein
VKTAPLLRALAVLFWLALCLTLVMALVPRPPVGALGVNDKVQHMAAFAVLSLLAWLAFPRQRLSVLLICPLLSGPFSVLDFATKEEWNGKEAQAGGDHRQAA